MGAGTRNTVDQEAGQADSVGEGIGDGARLVLRASEVPGPLRACGALLRGVPELDHDGAPVVGIGSEGLGAAWVGPLRHAGADREVARRFGEHGHGKGPGGHRARGDQADAGHRPRQRQPPAGPPRRPAGTASQQGGQGERRREGGTCQYRQHLPADPHHTQHYRGQHENRPGRRRDAWAGGGEASAPPPARRQHGKKFQRGHGQSRDDLGHPAILGAGDALPHRSRVAIVCDRGRNPWQVPVQPGSQSSTPDQRPPYDHGR